MRHSEPTSSDRWPRFAAGALLSAALVLKAGALHAQWPQPTSEPELRALLTARGFTNIAAVRFDDGVWTASADAPDGGRATVHVHANSGALFLADAEPRLDAEEVAERLSRLGYQDVHNVRLEDGLFKAEVETPTGQEMLVYVDPFEGEILGERGD